MRTQTGSEAAALSPTRLRCLDQPPLGHDQIHPDVVFLGRDHSDDLRFATDTDGERVRGATGEQSVIVAATTAEPQAAGFEGDTGAEEDADAFRCDNGAIGSWFPDPEVAGFEFTGG